MTYTIALSNLKGGTGKTTSAIMLGCAFADLGYTVEVIDLDPQGSATEWALTATDAGAPLAFPVIPGNTHSLRRATKAQVRIIDCPPGNAASIDTAITIADLVIIPVMPSQIEVQRMWHSVDLAEEKAIVLLTSVLKHTRATAELNDALTQTNTRTLPLPIPHREAIRRLYGAAPDKDAELFGYRENAEAIIALSRQTAAA